jgi:hypothetical protein
MSGGVSGVTTSRRPLSGCGESSRAAPDGVSPCHTGPGSPVRVRRLMAPASQHLAHGLPRGRRASRKRAGATPQASVAQGQMITCRSPRVRHAVTMVPAPTNAAPFTNGQRPATPNDLIAAFMEGLPTSVVDRSRPWCGCPKGSGEAPTQRMSDEGTRRCADAPLLAHTSRRGRAPVRSDHTIIGMSVRADRGRSG